MSIKTPIYKGLAQSDLDMAGFDLLNWSGGGGGTGHGIPAGGTTGQSLTKIDGTDYNAHWSTVTGGGGTDRKFDVKTYGAVGDGTTDDGVAIRAALAAIPSTGGVLYFPAGRYKYSGATLALDRQITVEGDGGGVQFVSVGPPIVTTNGGIAISTIDFNSATGTLFTVTTHGCTFKNLGLRNTSVTPPSAGAGILVSAGGDRTEYDSISVDGFYIDIDVQAGSAQTFEDCWIVAPVLYGLKLRNVAAPDGGDTFISNCYFCELISRIGTSAIRIESGGGLKVVNSKINANAPAAWTNGIDLAVGNGVVTVDLLVSNCSIEGFNGSGIRGTTGSGSVWKSIVITGNQISPFSPASTTQYGINLSPTNSGDFDGVVIDGNLGLGSSSNSFIALTNCLNVSVDGNVQTGYGGLMTIGSGVTFADSPVYIGMDARLVAISGGVKLECRSTGTGTWVEATRYTNP